MSWQYIGLPGFHGKLPLHIDEDVQAEMQRIRQLLLSRSEEPLELRVDVEAEPTTLVVNPANLAWWYLSNTA